MTTSTEVPVRFLNNMPNTFGEYTASVRWPIIIQNTADDLATEMENISKSKNSNKVELLREGEVIKQEILKFRQKVLDKKPIEAFTEEECEFAKIPASYNDYLKEQKNVQTWENGEWLYCEIYLYRRINVFFRKQPLWYNYDIFEALKQSTFKASFYGVTELALRYKTLLKDICKLDKSNTEDQKILKILFKEFVEISLWGNATDLSLLTNATLEEIKSIQGAKVREESESKILVNDTEYAWNTILRSSLGGKCRVDFVLDNSGFELYADLMFSSMLLHTGLASEIVFHAKDMPYMVSDVMLKDFHMLIADLRDRDFFPTGDATTDESQALDLFADDISDFYNKGLLSLQADSFWTTELDYWNIDPSETKYNGKEIHQELLKADLVIFKGDLNYRKLVGDRTWPRTTAWKTAIGLLGTNGITLLSLRTCKADAQVGLKEGLDEKLCKEYEVDHPGKGKWWSSSGKWAVICFSDSKK